METTIKQLQKERQLLGFYLIVLAFAALFIIMLGWSLLQTDFEFKYEYAPADTIYIETDDSCIFDTLIIKEIVK